MPTKNNFFGGRKCALRNLLALISRFVPEKHLTEVPVLLPRLPSQPPLPSPVGIGAGDEGHGQDEEGEGQPESHGRFWYFYVSERLLGVTAQCVCELYS